jgi:ABC-type phosphate/phosphonate transport system permease subunit
MIGAIVAAVLAYLAIRQVGRAAGLQGGFRRAFLVYKLWPLLFLAIWFGLTALGV